jgi:putative DNA primase/helicase
MGGNLGLINFLQKILGYSLTGSTREQCLFFLYGLGANGKSTLLEVVQSLWGDYATRTSSETFLAKKPGGIPNDVAALRGARLAAAVEVEQGRRLAEVLVKEMTGGDTISARFMRAEWFSFKPQFKIFLATNHKPIIRGTDFAIWRRIRLIPFTVQIPKEEQDRDLPEKLRGELPGILNWAMAGCLQWRFGGLEPPKEVDDATQDYRAEMDVLGDFIAERCILDPGADATAAELYKSYTSWAEENGEKRPLTQRAFGMSLTERGFERGKGTGNKGIRLGIGVRE